MCGTTKLLGKKNKFCPNCGAPQDPAWRYFPAETDLVFIENPKYEGADKLCPACNTPNDAAAHFCRNCGADLATAKEAAAVDSIETGFEGAKGVRDDVALKKWQQQQVAIKTADAKKRRVLGLSPTLLIVIAVAIIGIGLFAFLALNRTADRLRVADAGWKYTINTEKFAPYDVGSWISGVPGDAYNRTCAQKIKGYNQVPDGQEQVCRNVTVQVACGFTYKDNKDGSGSRTTKYCPEQQQKCSMETRYRQVPYFDTWCQYTVNRWGASDPVVASGGANAPPTWPDFISSQAATIGAQREAKRIEEYNVSFIDNAKKAYQYAPKTLAEYQKFSVNQLYSVDRNRLGSVFWETLKQVRE